MEDIPLIHFLVQLRSQGHKIGGFLELFGRTRCRYSAGAGAGAKMTNAGVGLAGRVKAILRCPTVGADQDFDPHVFAGV